MTNKVKSWSKKSGQGLKKLILIIKELIKYNEKSLYFHREILNLKFIKMRKRLNN